MRITSRYVNKKTTKGSLSKREMTVWAENEFFESFLQRIEAPENVEIKLLSEKCFLKGERILKSERERLERRIEVLEEEAEQKELLMQEKRKEQYKNRIEALEEEAKTADKAQKKLLKNRIEVLEGMITLPGPTDLQSVPINEYEMQKRDRGESYQKKRVRLYEVEPDKTPQNPKAKLIYDFLKLYDAGIRFKHCVVCQLLFKPYSNSDKESQFCTEICRDRAKDRKKRKKNPETYREKRRIALSIRRSKA